MARRRSTGLTAALACSIAWTVALGCSESKPEASGQQSLQATSRGGLTTLFMSGPRGAVGGIAPSEPAYLEIQLGIEGPADGMAIIKVDNPHSTGCDLTGGLPAYLELNESGTASLDAWVTLWTMNKCSFEIDAESATDYKGEYRDPDTGNFITYKLSGTRESTRLHVTFANLGPS